MIAPPQFVWLVICDNDLECIVMCNSEDVATETLEYAAQRLPSHDWMMCEMECAGGTH